MLRPCCKGKCPSYSSYSSSRPDNGNWPPWSGSRPGNDEPSRSGISNDCIGNNRRPRSNNGGRPTDKQDWNRGSGRVCRNAAVSQWKADLVTSVLLSMWADLMFLILDAKSVTDRRERKQGRDGRELCRNASSVPGPDTRRVGEQPSLGLEGCNVSCAVRGPSWSQRED